MRGLVACLGSREIPVTTYEAIVEITSLSGLLIRLEFEIATRDQPCHPRVGDFFITSIVTVTLDAHEVEVTVTFKSIV